MRPRRHGPRAVTAAHVLAALATVAMVVSCGARVASSQEAAVSVEKRIPYVAGGTPNQTLDVYRQEGAATGRVALVMVHGGGYAGGSPDDLSRQARLAARQGWVVFNVDYRTTSVMGTNGEAWPAERDDVQAAVRWVRDHATEYGADPRHVAMLGASAGGTLAALAASASDSPVRALALWSGPTDLATLVPDAAGVPPACTDNIQCIEFWRNPWVTNLLGCTPDACPEQYAEASPIAYASDMPSTYVANASSEVVPVVQAETFADALRAARITTDLQIVPGSRHAQTFTDSVWNETIPFLATELGVPVPEPVDFGGSLFGVGWETLAALLAIVAIVVAVVARITSDRRRGLAR